MSFKTERFTYVLLLINKKYTFFYTFGVNLTLDVISTTTKIPRFHLRARKYLISMKL